MTESACASSSTSPSRPRPGFEAIDIADEGIRLLFYLREETEKIVLIDAVDLGIPPESTVFSSLKMSNPQRAQRG